MFSNLASRFDNKLKTIYICDPDSVECELMKSWNSQACQIFGPVSKRIYLLRSQTSDVNRHGTLVSARNIVTRSSGFSKYHSRKSRARRWAAPHPVGRKSDEKIIFPNINVLAVTDVHGKSTSRMGYKYQRGCPFVPMYLYTTTSVVTYYNI